MTENYIFDLYGTLVDIHTDQTKKEVWTVISRYYLKAGAVWLPKKMKQAYFRMCEEEEEKLKTPEIRYPEIDLGIVFRRLYEEAPLHIPYLRKQPDSQWIEKAASVFRKASREKLFPYRNTITVLKQLKQKGKGVWLLSNAQTLFTVEELKMCGLYDLFDGIYISSDHGVKKPQKQFMEAMLKEYDIAKETALMIGNDMKADIGIACACGVPSVFLNTDGYEKIEIEQQMKEVISDPSCRPLIIESGDLAELLKPENGYA